MPKSEILEQYARYPQRTCYSLHDCIFCKDFIRLGDRYIDGGYKKRCHVACFERVKQEAADRADRPC